MTKIEISRRLKTVHFNTRVVLFDAIQCNSNSQRLYSPIRRAEHTSTQHAFYAVVLRVTESLCKGVLRRLESINNSTMACFGLLHCVVLFVILVVLCVSFRFIWRQWNSARQTCPGRRSVHCT